MIQPPRWLGHIAALVISLFAAFFVEFNVIFSDIFGIASRIQAFLFVLVVYFVLGFLMTKLWHHNHKTWILWLTIPPAIVVVLFTMGELFLLAFYNLSAFSAAVVGTLIGSMVGSALRVKNSL